MARRPLGGAGESRLGQIGAPTGAPLERPKIKKPTPGVRRNHTVRLSGTEESRLQRLVSRVGEEAGRPVRDSDILRGLLVLGEKIDTSQLLDAVRHAAFDSD
jgi:hypothetical protein